MEVPESDGTGCQGRDKLIRDISRSDCRCGAGITPEQHLMHLSRDPLLVREFLLRAEPSAPMPLGPSPLSSDVTVALTRSTLMTGSQEQAGFPFRSKHYLRREPLLEISFLPMVFEPSREDREVALDHDSRQQQSGAAASDLVSAIVFLALTIAFTMLFLTLLFVSD